MRSGFLTILILGLVACSPVSRTSQGFIANVPEEVAAIAAPNQDLSAVKIREEDGCYWYRHEGPVETTLLPLRNKAGRPICTARKSEAE